MHFRPCVNCNTVYVWRIISRKKEVCLILTEIDEVCGLDLSDLVEASIEVCGFFGKRGNLSQFWVITVNTAADTHTQQAGGHPCSRERERTVLWRFIPLETARFMTEIKNQSIFITFKPFIHLPKPVSGPNRPGPWKSKVDGTGDFVGRGGSVTSST